MFVYMLVFISSFLQSAATGPRCFECTRIPFARDCDHVRTCGKHEVCYTKQVVSSSGHVYYDIGCLDNLNCMAEDTVQDDETGDIISCLNCCHGDFCNSQGCGSQAFPIKDRGPVCFSCQKGSASPEKCDKVTTCGQDQSCFIRPFYGIGGDLLYEAGCKHRCSFDAGVVNTIVGKRDMTTCLGCCDTDFCNSNCSTLTHSSSVSPTKASAASSSTSTSTEHTSTRTTSTQTTSTQNTPTNSTHTDRSTLCKHLRSDYTYLKEYDHCVKIYQNIKLTWEQSRDQCRSDGGKLMIFHNKREEGYFETLTEQPTSEWDTKRYWVGASDLAHEGQWLWSDNTQVDQTFFYPNEPNNGGSHSKTEEDCAATAFINRTFLLNDDDCDNQYHFICEISLKVSNNTDLFNSSKCRNSHYTYSAPQGTCFHVYDVRAVTMEAARKACQSEGADLLQIKDRNSEQFFLDFGFKDKENNNRRYWLGARKHHDGHIYWLDGRTLDDSYIWAPGEPNNYLDSEECVDLTWFSANDKLHTPDMFALNDDNCSREYFFICEEDRGRN